MVKVGFVSLGCAKNLVDTENIIGLFDDPFFVYENDLKECDCIVINTCGFILSAKQEAIDTILEIAEYKDFKLKKLVVTGCFVQRYFDDCVKEFSEVDLFVKIEDYHKLPELLSELFDHQFIYAYGKHRVIVTKPFTSYLRISDGCDNRCAYCAIPLIRGNCVSRKMEDIVAEAKELFEKGVKELNIIAQDTTYYGYDLYGYLALKDLLPKLDEIGFKWIRLLYLYPDEIEEDLLVAMKNCKSVIPYFDVPTQYGNDEILKLMNRRGSVELIKEKIALIKSYFPDAIIRSTLIVGFPHETEDTFNDTMDFVEDIRFDSLGAFTYSLEEDTKAYDYDMQVDEEDANRRLDILMSRQHEIVEEKNKERIGKTYEVLIEGYEPLFKRYVARSYMSAPDEVDSVVYVYADDLDVGGFYNVEITDYNEYDLLAKLSG